MSFQDLKGTLYDFFGYLTPGIVLCIIGRIALIHSEKTKRLHLAITSLLTSISTTEIIAFVFVAYVIGHAASSFSSLIIEKFIYGKNNFLKKKMQSQNIVSTDIYTTFTVKFKDVFNIDFSDDKFRVVICYVQAHNIAIYDTAFVFLSIYGMARNFVFIFSSAFVWETYNCIILHTCSVAFIIVYFVLMLIFNYEYYRFRRYHKDHIINGFIVS